MNCPSCDTPLPDGARFCPSCGNSVVLGRLDERRVVTVLFADVVGFTALAERLDPEQVKRMIDGCMERLGADIAAFGGTVDKFLGDGVLALFGAPVAHEDDAERAVRAALRMQDTIGDTSTPGGAELQLRIGVNTGEVLVGALRARADYTAMGDVVNTAARLQSLAPPGRVLVGQATQQLTEDVISYEPFGEVSPRGREQPITAFLAIEPTTLPGGRRHRVDLPLVGREDELGLLLGGLRFAVGRNRAFLAAIEGEGGVGKSRIVTEVLGWMRSELELPVLEGSCVPYGESNAWWPLASAILGYLDLDISGVAADEIRVVAAARGAGLLGLPPGDPELVRLQDAFSHLLGLPSPLDDLEPARAREVLTRAVIAVLQARLRRGPLALAITDLHWADPAVLLLLEQTVAALAGLPFMLITTARPEAESVWPPAGGPYTSLRLRLEPLDLGAAGELVRSIVGNDVENATIARLYERSGGNPLFLEELATLVAESGETGELPETLRAIVAARLDQLPLEQRMVLDNAAVLGGSGAVMALVRFGEEMGVRHTERLVRRLDEAGLLAIEGRRWRFRSESVRDVAYQTLTKAARAQRHAGVAKAMAATDGDKQPRPEEVAHHYATAAELVAELGPIEGVRPDIAEVAVRWLAEAADRAADQMYPRAGVRLATRALDLLAGDESPAARVAARRLQLIRADSLADLRRLDKARLDVAAAMGSAIADGDRAAQGTAHRLLGEIDRFDGRLDDARAELDRSTRIWRELGDDHELARSLRSRGFLEVFGGTPAAAGEFLDEADDLYLRLGDRGGHAWVEQNRAWMSFLAGEISLADERLHKAAAVMEELGDRGGIGWAFGLLAYVRFYAGNREEATQIAESVLRDAAERGDDWAAGMMQALQANLQLWEGRVEESLRLAEAAKVRMRRLGDGYGQIQAMAPAIRAMVALGRFGEARTQLEELSSIAPRFGLEGFAALATLGVAVHGGAVERALDASAVALEIGRQRGGVGTNDVLLGRALAFLMADRLDDALAMLEVLSGIDHPLHPYEAAVSGLVAAVDRRPAVALAHARVVDEQPGATYLDRTYARLAEASAHLQVGELGEARVAVEQARMTVAGTDDVVARDLVTHAARALAIAVGGPDTDDAPAPAFTLPGWRTLLAALLPPASDRVPAADGVHETHQEP